ncbi:MAG: site-specific DNA-methyltransferase [Armatimonadetes bacterium]|nr:site-specific DNA-methyltransferase [Armatimonadota bacterium]
MRKFKKDNGAELELYNKDCIKGMAGLREKSVDVIVTSPPYNLGIVYTKYNDKVHRLDYMRWMTRWAKAAMRVLKDDGSLFLNVGSKPSDLEVPYLLIAVMRKAGFEMQNVIHWVKSIAINKVEVGNYPGITKDIVVGHYKPINSNRFLNDCHEYIFHLTKDRNVKLDRLAVGVPYQDKSNVGRWHNADRDVHCRGNTWFIPYDTINSSKDRPHPATFPIELTRRCIRLHGLERAKVVMDPFLGIGSSAVACAELGTSFIGFEIDKVYFDQACERVKGFDISNCTKEE